MAATAPLKAIATVILIDIMRVLSNHYSTGNQRAIAMVKQWRHCNGESVAPLEAITMANYLLLAIFHLQKTAFAMAPTVI